MTHLTEKENFMRLINGKDPEWLPVFSFGYSADRIVPTMKIGPELLYDQYYHPGIWKDLWGVPYESSASAGNQKLPQPNVFILEDIRRWRDVIKAPEIKDIDWETMARRDLERAKIDQTQTATLFKVHIGYFQTLMSFMGFSEGMCAMYEEPDEVKELMQYLSDFYVSVAEACIDYYHPDMLCITDDVATWANPFISIEMYRDMIKPYHKTLAEVGLKRGLPIEMHCCGRCEDMIDDWMEFGVKAWDPAQVSNDLTAVQKKYGKDLVVIGGVDVRELLAPDIDEEQIRSFIRKTIDTYTQYGSYAFYCSLLAAVGDDVTARKNRWITDEAVKYGHSIFR